MYRVNKLLEIEAVDWQRQLDRAVGDSSSLLLATSSFLFLQFLHGHPSPCTVNYTVGF